MKKIAVTGITGFVGKRLLWYDRDKYTLVPLPLREKSPSSFDLAGVDAVVHLAGKAHQMEPIDDKIYFDVNYELTVQLAASAKQQGVGQFIYISSVKVYGDDIHEVLHEQSPCKPTDAYGASKLKAEQELQAMEDAGFRIAIVRPSLVYGPEVKGNMIRLLQLAAKNYPLPLGDIRNARSMVFVDNLVALINAIIEQQASGVFVAGDAEPVSTDQLLSLMRKHLGNAHRLLSIPQFMRGAIKKLMPGFYHRLFGSFVIDNSAGNSQLHFAPPYTTDEGVAQMVQWFKQQ